MSREDIEKIKMYLDMAYKGVETYAVELESTDVITDWLDEIYKILNESHI